MMADAMTLEIITPERVVLKEEVASVVVPGTDGYWGILPHHAAMIASLRIGVVKYRQGDRFYPLAIGGGFFEVVDNRAVILANTAERPEEIDIGRAQAAAERARRRLQESSDETDVQRAEAALKRALNRLRVAKGE